MRYMEFVYRALASSRLLSTLAALLLCAALALSVGYMLAEVGVLISVAALLALGLGILMLRNMEVAYWSVIGVVCLLPFASFPFNIGFTPTFLDAALVALFMLWLLRIATGRQREFIATPLGLPVVVFMLITIGAFVSGLSHAALTSYVLRHFAEILLSIALFFLVVNTVQDAEMLRRLARALLLCAFMAAFIGVVLYLTASYISSELVIRALSALGRLGYPTGPGVLRYIRDDPELPMRATSTSIDPNVLGSLLNITLGIGVPQLFAARPLFPRRYLVVILGTMALCLGLTISRGSLVGATVALGVVATLRYRKLWLIMITILLLITVLPQTQGFVNHFIEGVRGEDLATQMRFGEYKDALILISRYPWLGVGFAGAPDIDTYIGVANVYLIIAEQTGLIGLAGFLLVMVMLLVRFWRKRHLAVAYPMVEPLWWGFHAGVMGALVGGIFDHYFFNLDFPHSATLFWLIVGLAAVADRILEQDHTSRITESLQ